LKDHAQLKKDVVIIGVSSRVEVWSKEVWERYSQEAQQDYEAIAENLTDLNFDL
jgi:MraZ protein